MKEPVQQNSWEFHLHKFYCTLNLKDISLKKKLSEKDHIYNNIFFGLVQSHQNKHQKSGRYKTEHNEYVCLCICNENG